MVFTARAGQATSDLAWVAASNSDVLAWHVLSLALVLLWLGGLEAALGATPGA